MNPEDYKHSTAGKAILTSQGYWTFAPNALPPEINWSGRLVASLSEADRCISTLAGMGRSLPNPYLLTQPIIHLEAVLSSRIEGTRASLDDLFLYNATQLTYLTPGSDAGEVSNYVRALQYGIERLKTLPISARLMRELYTILLEDVRGGYATPGEFRRSQNWIGPPGSNLVSAPFVPPPVDEMLRALDQLEKFLHTNNDLPPLIHIALIHYQFEAIHPFLDGNGRIGRLLIILLMIETGLLNEPVLYLSAFFETNRPEYYRRLLRVSQYGDWEGWMIFFLKGVKSESLSAAICIKRLERLHSRYWGMVANERAAERLRQVINLVFTQPVITVRLVKESMGLSDYKVAQRYVKKLEQLGLLREVSGRKRGRVFRADGVMQAIAGVADAY